MTDKNSLTDEQVSMLTEYELVVWELRVKQLKPNTPADGRNYELRDLLKTISELRETCAKTLEELSNSLANEYELSDALDAERNKVERLEKLIQDIQDIEPDFYLDYLEPSPTSNLSNSKRV